MQIQKQGGIIFCHSKSEGPSIAIGEPSTGMGEVCVAGENEGGTPLRAPPMTRGSPFFRLPPTRL
ncbi:hypothetical protein C5O22_10695 [Treponema sp. J25]|nr:hypothetical protein C5O22_10695 [Treponema sp. J25]